MSKGSKLKRAAMAWDVTTRVYFGLYTSNLANPYPADDPRHALFARELARVQWLDEESKAIFEVYGVEESSMPRRHHDDPGPVLELDELVAAFSLHREQCRQIEDWRTVA